MKINKTAKLTFKSISAGKARNECGNKSQHLAIIVVYQEF